ncbi:MAG: glycosyltransferase family 39 protein [Paracoccaceae bacterium]
MWSVHPEQTSPRLVFLTVSWTRVIVLLLAALVIALAVLTLRHNVNWDEFHFLQQVHEFHRGAPLRALQTFHVHLMQWLVHLPAGDLTQIFVGRALMLGLLCGTGAFIYLVARSLTDANSALIGVLAFGTSGYVILHGASFRADPLIAFLLMGALAILFTSRMSVRWMALAAVMAALAMAVSIKSALYLPAFLAVMVWRGSERGMILRTLATGALFVGFAVLLHFWHAAQLDTTGTQGSAEATAAAMKTTLLSDGLLPRARYVIAWIADSIVPLTLAVVALVFSFAAPRDDRLRRFLTLALLALPVASVLFYRNAFPYFFPFIVPPLMVVVAVGASRLTSRPALLAGLVVLMVASGVMQIRRAAEETNTVQAGTLAAIHAMFPAPVAYIDRNGMVPSFHKVGFFMSSWGRKNYHEAGRPILAPLVRDRQPPLVIANTRVLEDALKGAEDTCCGLLEADRAALDENYVHHSGAIWLAGKTVQLDASPTKIDVLIAGRYRVRSGSGVTIGDRRVTLGDIVQLPVGETLVSADAPTELELVWAVPGDKTATAPKGNIYADF